MATRTIEGDLKAIENAVGICQLRLSADEWSQTQGNKMLPNHPTEQLLAMVASLAIQVRADVIADKATGNDGDSD